MGVHNEKEEYLRLAIDSILNQTYADFEFIIIDDFSDSSCEIILREFAKKDSRISLYRNETNYGLTKSLNKGLSLAKGEYIARMDADDYSTRDRFQKQIDYLNSHQDIDLLGGGVVSFGTESMFMSPAFGYSNDVAQCNLFFQSTLCHPSVIIRKSFLDRYNLKYDENVRKGQDYDMWERCSVYGKLAVMNDVVLYYRTHSSQITSTNRGEQDETARMVRTRRLNRIGIEPTEHEYNCHLMLLGEKNDKLEVTIDEVKAWMDKIVDSNNKYKVADPLIFRKNLRERFILYKGRRGRYSLIDIPILFKIAISRYKMHKKLVKHNYIIRKFV